jgi:ribonuclease P protein component
MKYTLKIKKNNVFRYIFKKGKYSKGKNIVLHVLNTNSKYKNNNFFGVCVSKKNGNSVQRNKLKRWAREVYKEEEENFKKGYNIIIMYKKEVKIDKLNFFDVKKEFIKCLKDLGIYEK